jgi:UDP-N-acetylmuramyl pentapeptide phosphotransferase/UDP-N-acetylglucosamine-1-phosphate transferase
MTDGWDHGLRLWAGAGALFIAAALSFVLIVLLRPLLRRYALARPNARSSHREPTPQGGGIAVIAATIVAGLAITGMIGELKVSIEILSVLAAAVLIALLGGIDDLRPMPVVPRLLFQMLAIVLVIAAMPEEARLAPWLPYWAERICLLLAFAWFVNLVNFMDGIDWMTVAEVVPLTSAIALFGVLGTISLPSTVFAFALVGAMLGFAPFNKPVAKLFLGDVGSLPIGLLLGWLLLQLAQQGQLAAALLLPLYYLADATITLGRRIFAGETFWHAHRSHFYQRACDLGWSVHQIVGRVFVANLALAGLAFVTIASHVVWTTLLSIGGGVVLVAWLLASFATRKR